jgi:cutinase
MTKHILRLLSLISVAVAQTGRTASDVENGVCKPMTLIFARGTTEQGNMGSIVGPPLADAMIALMGADQVAVQGVNYPANVAGAISGATNPRGAQGAKTMANLASKVAANCPDSKVVLAGYSQVHRLCLGHLMRPD